MGVTPTIAVVDDGHAPSLPDAVDGTDQTYRLRKFDSVASVRSTMSEPPTAYLVVHDPPQDGFDVVERLHREERNPTVVVVAREHDGETATRAANADLDGYVPIRDEASTDETRVLETIVEAVESPPSTVRDRELERYRTIVEASGDPVYTLDPDGYVTFANEALATLSGYDLDEVVGEHVSTFLRPSDVDRGESLIRDLLASADATQGTFELELDDAAGETVVCENHVALLPSDEEFRGTVGVLRDVTERKQKAAALQEQRDRFSAVFETIPEPIVHLRIENDRPVVENVNSAFTKTFGIDETNLEGRSINDAIVPADLVDEANTIDADADEIDFVERTVQRETPDGLRDFRLRATRFDARGGREAIVAYLDITQQKQRQRELERQNDRLDEFASVVSHDLRNPLNVANGRLELARSECDSPHLADVADALDRMEGLVSTVLTLARYGQPVTEGEPVEIATVARRSWKSIESNGAASLDVDVDQTVVGNRSRLRSLFENLFRNAVEHGGEDVSVVVTDTDEGFAVADDGPGLPDGDVDVFETGFTTDEDGTGFGLNIVREIARAHGWKIHATDAADGGARFEFGRVETTS